MNLSERLFRNLQSTNLKPILVWQIEGVPTLYTSSLIKRSIKYGDPGLEYGDPGLLYGGLAPIGDQSALISLDGTTTSIKQTLDPDKGRGSGVTQMSVVLIDKNLEATRLASGQTYGEILYKKCKVWVGFNDESNFNNDFILIFRGIVESIKAGPGKISFNLSSPEDKKRQALLLKADTKLNGAINNSVTTLTLDSVENLFVVPDHPAYSTKDDDLKSYVKIDNELIQFTGISGLQLTGCLRGQLGTTAVSHADDAQVTSFYKLEGNSMDLALKIMLSDPDQTPYIENLTATSVNYVNVTPVSNAIFFSGINLERDYNVRTNDYVKTSGFTNGGNNFSSYKKIVDVVVDSSNSTYIVLDPSEVTLVDEPATTGQVDFLSYYNSLGECGLGLDTDEVDIERHEFLKLNYLSTFNYKFYLREEIDEVKEFIEQELYIPAACYSLPSDKSGLSRVSVGIHRPPLPSENTIVIAKSNVVGPEKIEIQRSVNKYYYNAIVYRYEDSPLIEDFTRRVFVVSGTPQIDTGNKPKIIDSFGLKDSDSAQVIATAAGTNLLQRYKYAAEYIQKVQLKFSDGVQIVVGDVVVFDPTDLKVFNPTDDNRERPAQLFEVINKEQDNKSGKITLDLVNTAFNINARYGKIGPSSRIAGVISQKKFVIESMLDPSISQFGTNEYRKWTGLGLPAVKIRTANYSNTFETKISSINLNTIELRDNVGFTLNVGDIIELADYNNAETSSLIKLQYVFLSDGSNNFGDGKSPYLLA